MLLANPKQADQFISDFKDPFKMDKIEKIHIWIMRGIFNSNTILFQADVSFKNGNTSGKQEFEAEDFQSLVLKVQSFINGL